MLIEKRPNLRANNGGWCEFHSTETAVEFRLLGPDGQPDSRLDGLHSLLNYCRIGDDRMASCPSLTRVEKGVTRFPAEAASIDWKPIEKEHGRIWFFNDEELVDFLRETREKIPASFKLLCTTEWSGSQICKTL